MTKYGTILLAENQTWCARCVNLCSYMMQLVTQYM